MPSGKINMLICMIYVQCLLNVLPNGVYHTHESPCWLGLCNTLTAPLQRGEIPPMRLPVDCRWWWDPGIGAVLDPATVWSSDLQHTTLALTRHSDWPTQSGWLRQAPICFALTIYVNLHLQQFPNLYLLGGRRRWVRVSCVERISPWPLLNFKAFNIIYKKPEIDKGLRVSFRS